MLWRAGKRKDAMTIAFEDFHVGQEFRFGEKQVIEDEIIAFAREFDPQPFHLDKDAAAKSLLGGLAASGWHTCAMTMRMVYDDFLSDTTGVGAPGIEECRWLKPVRAGMVLTVRWTIKSLRVSQSRPDLGLAGIEAEVSDKRSGDIVMTQRHINLFTRRDPKAPIPAPQGEVWPRPELPPEPPRLDDAAANRTRFGASYEDTVLGASLPLGSHFFAREETMDFARRFDPQPFHLDDAEAAKTHFGRLSASGWHTAATYMRLFVATRDRIRDENRAKGMAWIPNGPSPGFRNLSWFKPVFAGDTISYDSTVIGKRPSSKPGWGLVLSRSRGFNQDGVKVFESHGASTAPMKKEA
jgi:acyl dehydratase